MMHNRGERYAMSEKPLDCRGLACPNPVIKTKELIDRGDVQQLTVLVDNPAAQENVSRFLQRAGFEVQVGRPRRHLHGHRLPRRPPGPVRSWSRKPEEAPHKILVLMGSDTSGPGR